ncbi:ribonuclease H-like domain-containing protein [Mycena capillaripes]|nr:ribonuclease H-like domain-containing protein [Mycena capillaripes]
MSYPPPNTRTAPLSRKRTKRLSPEPGDDNPSVSKRARALVPSQSFADVMQEMPDNDLTLAGPHLLGPINTKQALVFQLVDVLKRESKPASDLALLFGVTEEGVRVLVHVTNFSALLGTNQWSVAIFLRHYKLPAMSWIELPAEKYQVIIIGRLSHNQTEVMIKHKDIIIHASEGQWKKSAPLRILSFDIETRVRQDFKFTQYHQTAELPVIQIGNIIQINGDNPRTYRGIFTLRGCTEIAGAEVRSFENESAMLSAWRQFIVDSDPDLITGHNIARFDFVYLLFRAEKLGLPIFPCLGRLQGVNATALKVNPGAMRLWKDAPVLAGRLQLDTYQYIQEWNARNRGGARRLYTLNAVSQDFLDSTKEDLNFKLINGLQDGTDDDRKNLAVYCLKDTYLPLQLLYCDALKCLQEAITAARSEQHVNLPLSDFLRCGRN